MTKSAIVAGIAAAILATVLLASHAIDAIELPLRDAALRRIKPVAATHTAVVAIDENSIRTLGRWPWDRSTLAQIVDRIANAGARAVIVDVLIAENAPGDDQLARSLKRVPSIAVAALNLNGWLLPVEPIRAAATPAHGIFERDHDGISRRFASTKQSGNQSLAAMSAEAASMITSLPIAVGASIAPLFRTRPQSIPQISAASVLRNPNIASRLRDKLVFIGETATALGDRVLTPVSNAPDPGVTVQAAATESLIRGDTLQPIAPIVAGVICGLIVTLIVIVSDRRAWTIGLTLLFVMTTVIAGQMLLANRGIAIPFFSLLVSSIATGATVETRRITSALRQSDAAVSRLKARREEDAESKRILAHELRTPLASMRGLSQLLAGFDLTDAERRRVATLLDAEAGKLQSLVGGLLDLERLPLRDFESSTSIIDLGDVVRTRINFLQASADRPLTVRAEPNVFVRADASLIERVVDNLAGNALKYAPAPAAISITARSSANAAVIEVEDRGPGLTETDRQRVFDRFFRASTAAGTTGFGLGLSFVAEIAKWHGGSVSVESGSDGGTLFRFTLPLANAAASAGVM